VAKMLAFPTLHVGSMDATLTLVVRNTFIYGVVHSSSDVPVDLPDLRRTRSDPMSTKATENKDTDGTDTARRGRTPYS